MQDKHGADDPKHARLFATISKSNGFIEIETPINVASHTRKGRATYVPSRPTKGMFSRWRSPLSSTKQTLMVGGIERY